MIRVNLIPAHRRDAARRRRHLRSWTMVGAGYAALILIAAVGTRAIGLSDPTALAREVELVEQDLGQSKAAISALRHELAGVHSELQATRAVGRQPDWSILLALLANTLGDEVVLRSCRLDRGHPDDGQGQQDRGRGGDARGAAAEATGDAPLELRLELVGLGRTQQAVTSFVLRLEKERLFSAVQLLDTRREPFFTDDAVVFRIECTLDTAAPAGSEQGRDS